MLRSLESTTYRLCAALVLQREQRHRQVRQTAASPRAECAAVALSRSCAWYCEQLGCWDAPGCKEASRRPHALLWRCDCDCGTDGERASQAEGPGAVEFALS